MRKRGLMMIPDIDLSFYIHALPILALLGGALLLMLFAVSRWLADPSIIFISSVTFIVGALLSSLLLPIDWIMIDQRLLEPSISYNLSQNSYSIFGGSYLVDGLAVYGQVLVLLIGLTICLLIKGSRLAERFFRGDIACLFVLTLAGMAIMVSSVNLLTIFIGLEIFSLGSYALIGYIEPSQRSQEAAIKYFILGSFAAALLLFGFAFIYAGTGSLDLPTIAERLTESNNLVRIAAVFIIAGIAFKLALVPCHLWTPDAYQGAPTAITALMATTAKAVIILLAIRLLTLGITDIWLPIVILFAGLSMIVGNVLALAQTDLKRLFAYSSIAHGGYIALALAAVAKNPTLGDITHVGGIAYSAFYYIEAYCLMSLGAFAVIMWLENNTDDNLQLTDLAGLAKRHPFASFALAGFALAFAGMPPTVGFFAKFLVFRAALEVELYPLVVIAVVGSGISFYYYLWIIVQMYFSSGDEDNRLSLRSSKIIATIVGFTLLATVFGGLFGSLYN